MIFSEGSYSQLSFSEASGILDYLSKDYLQLDLEIVQDICFDQEIVTAISFDQEILTFIEQDVSVTRFIDFDEVTI